MVESDPCCSKPGELIRISSPHIRLTVMAVALSALIIILFVALPPFTLLGKADVVGYAVCHRIPERSFELGDRYFPLCARCTGTFLGAMLGLVAAILRRRRASRLPPVTVLGVLVFFVALWAFDGLNSYLTLFPGAPHLYEPQNWLRLTTGMLNGLALVLLVLPIANFTLWREVTSEPVLKNPGELLTILPVAALLIGVLVIGIRPLLVPLALISSLGVVVMLTLVNAILATVALGREGTARTGWEALVPLSVGLGMALAEIMAMALLRAYLTMRLSLPF